MTPLEIMTAEGRASWTCWTTSAAGPIWEIEPYSVDGDVMVPR